jgi:opacity protein-like surface antigen
MPYEKCTDDVYIIEFTNKGVVSVSQRITLLAIVATSLLVCAPAFAQTEGGRSEVSAQFFGTFVRSTSQSGVQESNSDSGGVLATYRFFFSKHHGVEANYAYSRSTTAYSFLAGPSAVEANQHEWTGAYVFRMPIHNITPFVEAGVGGLTFAPINRPDASTQSRAAFVYGGGLDMNVTHRLFIRAQYRGLVFNTPTFNLVANLGLDRTTHMAEPSIGLGFRF